MYEFRECQKFSNSRIFNFENRYNLWISCKSRIYTFLKYLSLRAVQERTNVQKKERYQITFLKNWVSTKWIFLFPLFAKIMPRTFAFHWKSLKFCMYWILQRLSQILVYLILRFCPKIAKANTFKVKLDILKVMK